VEKKAAGAVTVALRCRHRTRCEAEEGELAYALRMMGNTHHSDTTEPILIDKTLRVLIAALQALPSLLLITLAD
jgi:hypothetical protein